MADLSDRIAELERGVSQFMESFQQTIEMLIAHWEDALRWQREGASEESMRAILASPEEPWIAMARIRPTLAAVHPSVHHYFINHLKASKERMDALIAWAERQPAGADDLRTRVEFLEALLRGTIGSLTVGLNGTEANGGGVNGHAVPGTSGGGSASTGH